MDEPLGALDKNLRGAMQIEIKRLHRQTGATMLFVTHDRDEALALSDRICLMNHARVEQIGTPREIYRRPASIFAAEFIGTSNILPGAIRDGTIETADGRFDLCGVSGSDRAISFSKAALMIRPEHLRLVRDTGAGPVLTGTVMEAVYAGAETRLVVALPCGTVMTVRHTADETPPEIGTSAKLTWDPGAALLLPA
jgi:putative spermidine/putrescine transport system ATP-binding protein